MEKSLRHRVCYAVLILLFLSFIKLSGQSGCVIYLSDNSDPLNCSQAEEELRYYYREYQYFSKQFDVLLNENKRINRLLDAFDGLVDIQNGTVVPHPYRIPDTSEPDVAGNGNIGRNNQRINIRLRRRVDRMVIDSARLRWEIRDLDRKLTRTKNIVIRMQSDSVRAATRIDSLYEVINEKEDTIFALRSTLNCIDSTVNYRRQLVQNGRTELNALLLKFNRFEADYKRMSIAERKDSAKYIWNTFKKYEGDSLFLSCGGINTELKLDFLQASHKLAYAQLLKRYSGDIIPLYPGKDDEQAIARNTDLLRLLAQVIAEGNYNQQSDAQNILDVLPEFWFDIRRQNAYSEVVALVDKVNESFNQEDYSVMMSRFARLKDYMSLPSVKGQRAKLAEAKYNIGLVLLFNIGEINRLKPTASPESNLHKMLDNSEGYGADLLKSINLEDDVVFYEKAALALSKQYISATKSSFLKND